MKLSARLAVADGFMFSTYVCEGGRYLPWLTAQFEKVPLQAIFKCALWIELRGAQMLFDL